MGENAAIRKLVVRGLFVTLDPDEFFTTPANLIEVDCDFGVINDRRHGGLFKNAGIRDRPFVPGDKVRNDRQFSAVSVEELGRIAELLEVPEIRPEWLGANILFEGLASLSMLPPLTLLIFEGGAALRVFTRNIPCKGPGDMIQAQYPDTPGLTARFVREALELRGTVGWVHKSGKIQVGETAVLHPHKF